MQARVGSRQVENQGGHGRQVVRQEALRMPVGAEGSSARTPPEKACPCSARKIMAPNGSAFSRRHGTASVHAV